MNKLEPIGGAVHGIGFLADDADRRVAAIGVQRDPSGRFASCLTSDPGGLNVHD